MDCDLASTDAVVDSFNGMSLVELNNAIRGTRKAQTLEEHLETVELHLQRITMLRLVIPSHTSMVLSACVEMLP